MRRAAQSIFSGWQLGPTTVYEKIDGLPIKGFTPAARILVHCGDVDGYTTGNAHSRDTCAAVLGGRYQQCTFSCECLHCVTSSFPLLLPFPKHLRYELQQPRACTLAICQTRVSPALPTWLSSSTERRLRLPQWRNQMLRPRTNTSMFAENPTQRPRRDMTIPTDC